MANNLKREIKIGEEVIVNAEYLHSNVDPVFICEGGFGMSPFTMGSAIIGKWKDGESGRIDGFMIDCKATKKHQEELSNAKTN